MKLKWQHIVIIVLLVIVIAALVLGMFDTMF